MLEELVRTTEAWLDSPEALGAIALDPYWPKWDGPWWRMLLLYEMGLASRFPRACVKTLTRTVDRHCLHFFPARIEDLPPGADPIRNVACHCQLGTVYQVLSACGVDVDRELPWIRPWFLKYQLPDGGLNCDESAYTKAQPHSSFVSTLPPLEAVLFCTRRPFADDEIRFLDRGAEYLIRRNLCRSISRGTLIDAAWLRPAFPRFYFYDVLRGLRFLRRWAERLGRTLPQNLLLDPVGAPDRRSFAGTFTRRFVNGSWKRVPAATFDLLDAVDPSLFWSPFSGSGVQGSTSP